MKEAHIRRALTFWCVVLLLPATLAVASSKKKTDPIADLRTAIVKNVADQERAARMSSAVDDMERLIQEAVAFAGKLNAELTPMLKDYGATREAIEAKFGELNGERAVLAEKMLEAHLAFKAASTAAEWKKLRKVEERALVEALGKSLQGEEPSEKEG